MGSGDDLHHRNGLYVLLRASISYLALGDFIIRSNVVRFLECDHWRDRICSRDGFKGVRCAEKKDTKNQFTTFDRMKQKRQRVVRTSKRSTAE
jgi:hypothetical protein